MIQRLSHVSIYVLDPDAAYDFYIDKLGFEVRMDHKMDHGFRCHLQIVLMPITPSPMMDQETSDTLRALIRKGVRGAGVFEELTAKGVEFKGPPEERFYGIEALMKDNSGNWFSMTQPEEAFNT